MLAICHIVHNHLLNAIILTWVDYTLDLPCGIIAQIIWHFNFIVCLHGLQQPVMIKHAIILGIITKQNYQLAKTTNSRKI